MKSKNLRILFIILGIGVGIFFLSYNAVAASQDSNKEYRLVFFVKNVVNPFWKEVKMGADQAAKDIGNVQITHAAPTKAEDIAESVNMIENTITKYRNGQVDAMVFVPVDYKALVPAVEKANKAGLPIINYCNELTAGGDYVTFVGLDEVQLSYDAATYILKKLDGKGNVVIIEGVPGAMTSQLRMQGFHKALKEYPNVKLLSQQAANYNRAKAMQVMENLIQQYPTIDAVLSANDEMALGVIQALTAAGRLKDTMVSGVDASLDGVDAIKEGKLTVTVNYLGYQQGYDSVKLAIDYLNGKKLKKREILQHVLVDKSNADEVYELKKKVM